MKTLYRKNLTKQDNKQFSRYDYNEKKKTKQKIEICKKCKYFLFCESEITMRNFNFKHKKAKRSFYYELENEYDGCLLLQKGGKNNEK